MLYILHLQTALVSMHKQCRNNEKDEKAVPESLTPKNIVTDKICRWQLCNAQYNKQQASCNKDSLRTVIGCFWLKVRYSN